MHLGFIQGIADLKSHLISDKHCKAVSGAS